MTTNPYAADSPPISPPTNNAPYRRPSYATVAAGTAASDNLSPARFNTLANFVSPYPSDMAASQRQMQPARQRSRSSLRSMDIDEQGGSGARKRPASSWSNDVGKADGRMGCLIHDDHPAFFTPSYLRHSRHVQRLQKKWDDHIAELRENMQMNPQRQPSLSASSSNVNLNKMHTSHIHRGVVQDVIERIPLPTDEDRSHPLPSKLNEDDKKEGLEVLGEGMEVRFTGVTKSHDEAASIRADHSVPKECGLYYYEVTILSRNKDPLTSLGFTPRKANLNRLPGWEPDSYGYHGDDGFTFASNANGRTYGPKFRSHDVVGCGVNFRTGSVFFTKNGVFLGVAHSNVKNEPRLYPCVGMKKTNDHVRINFGQSPFVFDIDRMMEQERQFIMDDIRNTDISSLYPSDKEDELIHSLVAQYLAHEGYVETAKAFAQDVNDLQKSTSSLARSLRLPNAEDDVHAANRQKIRKAILDGDIDKALKYTNCFYPRVLEEERNRDIHFRLRCRKFIEMMRRYTELSSSTTTSLSKSIDSLTSSTSNGHTSGGIDISEPPPPTDTQMELDDQLHRETSHDVDMTTSHSEEALPLPSKASILVQTDLLSQALTYGQELQSAFGNDPRQQIKKQLSDIFAIMAYTNPGESVVGQLMDPRGRAVIAEEVNRAILVSLGKPESAALEKLSAQAEAFMDEAASKAGGASGFVNVKRDFLEP